jgi:hypothetical protein
MKYRMAAAVLVCVLSMPVGAVAQSLRQQCIDMVESSSYEALCVNVADAMEIVQPRLGIALSGGNPVPGTASTLGMRLGSLPRTSLAARVTAAPVDLPPIERVASTSDVDFAVASVAVDASIGVFQGFALAPTVGGFGSLDVLGSIGIVPLPGDEGFRDRSPFTWAAGARLGLMRESFSAPGVSLSAMYRSLGKIEYGGVASGLVSGEREAFFRTRDYRVVSLRAVVGKRLVGFGLAGGAGYDRYRADVLIRVCDPTVPPLCDSVKVIQQDGFSTSRISLFANASYTLLLVSFVAEAGWQQGGDDVTGGTDKIEKGALFGGLAIRVGF